MNYFSKARYIFEPLYEAIKQNKLVSLSGMAKEATGHLLLNLRSNLKRPVFAVLETDRQARALVNQLRFFMDDGLFLFPSLEVNFQTEINFDFNNKMDRLKTLDALTAGKAKLIVTYPEALMSKLDSKKDFMSRMIDIDLDSLIDTDDFLQKLIDLGYERQGIVGAKGEFSMRGDIIDIFQVGDDQPTRIELFGDEVDSIRQFDVQSQLSLGAISSFRIVPNTEINFSQKEVEVIAKNMLVDMNKMKAIYGDEIYNKAYDKFNGITQRLVEQNYIFNPDILLAFTDQSYDSIFDYLPDDTLVAFLDFARIYQSQLDSEQFMYDQYKYGLEAGDLLLSHSKSYFSTDDIHNRLKNFQYLNVSAISKQIRLLDFNALMEINAVETASYHGRFDAFIEEVKFRIEDGYQLVIFTDGQANADSLKEQLEEASLFVSAKDSDLPGIQLDPGYLELGFEYPREKLMFLSYYSIFQKKKHKKKTRKKIKSSSDFINYTDLQNGDYIVHENYGVGKYLGIKNLSVAGSTADYLEIAYRQGDKLFIPTTEMNLVSKYVGSGDIDPKLSKLNSTEWTKTRQRAKKAIEAIADNLVELYAKRAKITGHAFAEDTPWQKEFEDAFIYEETPSQLQASYEIKKDMEKPIPMDRLLCGDVGYGKTEVAFRAAFKAIMDGKQVVMLAPTTILVKQHYKNMLERFRHFPINIDFLSRFKTPSQKDEIKRKLASGWIDFVVGTHALLADSVSYKDVGLLIIDEEQRFGVKHKEKIKELSEAVDVLTLSATPIPRTLQMSLSGIREMSLLDDPPQNRLPVNTYVLEYEPSTIRTAILREMARGGQVYFVYNRVRGLGIMKKHLEELVPEARIEITHGQMSAKEIDAKLDLFLQNEVDILLTTTIIETGMDIQNVNTIIVYNADKMGLSQLYQLKGRIGRSDRSAYAYFTFEKHKAMTEIAEQRLKAIKDFTELGGGYKIAMRDLELRGAGNLLGESQSGHIEAVGYDLYVKMLKEAIDVVKDIEPKKKSSARVDVALDAFIPTRYIEDDLEKINMYRKISAIEVREDYDALIDELIDRFGDYPQAVQNLLDLAYIKATLEAIGFDEMVEKDGNIEFSYKDFSIFNVRQIESLSKRYKGFVRFELTEPKKIIIEKDANFIRNTFALLSLIEEIKGEMNEKENY